MAHLLGAKDCIESLRTDVTDLQIIISDICKKINDKPKYNSWRSPDILSCDLDIDGLLEKHIFCADAEENQLSHIVLIELVIDRLVLIIQLLQHFLGQGTDNQLACNRKSIGIIAKRFWNVMDSFIKNLMAADVASYSHKDKAAKINSALVLVDPFKEVNLKIKYSEEGCQTMETLFVGCLFCKNIQTYLVFVLDQIFHLHNCLLKNGTFKIKGTKHDVLMKESEIYAILEDGKKCLREVEEVFIGYEEKIKALKASGEEKSIKNKKTENALLKIKKDLEITKETNKTLEFKIKNLEAAMDQMKIKHESDAKLFKKELEEAKNELQMMKTKFEEEKQINKISHSELKNKLIDDKCVREHLEKDLQGLVNQLQDVSNKLNGAHLQLKKKELKYQNYYQQFQFIYSKQESLIKRIEIMDEKNEELEKRASEAEKFREDIDTEIKALQNKKNFSKVEAVMHNEGLVTPNHEFKGTQTEYEYFKNESLESNKGMSININDIIEDCPSQKLQNVKLCGWSPPGIESSLKSITLSNKTNYHVTEEEEYNNGNLELITRSPTAEVSMKEEWSCSYCGEWCSNSSDLNLHATYCIFKT